MTTTLSQDDLIESVAAAMQYISHHHSAEWRQRIASGEFTPIALGQA
jgi:hypothetical protein